MPFDALTYNETQLVLLRAKEMLTEETWARGSWARPDRMCSIGALMVAQDIPAEHGNGIGTQYQHCGEPYRFLERAIGGGFVGNWNDDRQRTLSEVHAAFDEAVRLAGQE